MVKPNINDVGMKTIQLQESDRSKIALISVELDVK
jgi:hypothetical protein